MPELSLGVQTDTQQALRSLQGVRQSFASLSNFIRTDFVRSLDAAERALGGFSEELDDVTDAERDSTQADNDKKKSLGDMVNGFIKANIIMAAVTMAFNALKDAFVGSIKAAIEFNKEFANVTTLVDTAKVNTQEMRAELLALDNRLGSASELTKGLYQTLSAGVDAAKAVQFVGEAAKFAVAGLTDTETAVDVLTTTLNAYGLSAGEVTRVSDVFFQTIKLGKINGEQLAATLGDVVPLAANLGVNIEEVSAIMALFTKQGINASNATTRINATMTSFLKPSKAMQKALEELGFTSGSVAITELGGLKNAVDAIIDVTGLSATELQAFQSELANISKTAANSEEETMLMDQAFERLKNSTGASKDAMAELFPSVRALQGVLALTGEGAKDFDEILNSITNSTGATDEAFLKQKTTFAAMQNSLNKTAIIFGEFFLPVLEEAAMVIEGVSDNIRAFLSETDKISVVQKILSDLFSTFAQVGAIVSAIFTEGLFDIIKSVSDILTELGASFGVVGKDINIFKITMLPLMFSLRLLNFAFKTIADTITFFGDLIKAEAEFIGGSIGSLKKVFDAIIQAFFNFNKLIAKGAKSTVLLIQSIFDKSKRKEAAAMWDDAKKAFETFTSELATGIQEPFKVQERLQDEHLKNQKDAWETFSGSVAENFLDEFVNAQEKMVTANRKSLDIMQDDINDVTPPGGKPEGDDGGGGEKKPKMSEEELEELRMKFQIISGLFSEAANSISSDFEGIAGTIGDVAKQSLNIFSNLFDTLADKSATMGEKVAAGIAAGIQAIGVAVDTIFSEIDKGFDNQLSELETQAEAELAQFDKKEEDKVAIAEQRLAEQQELLTANEEVLDEKRLAELENYAAHLEGMTDEDIQRALEEKEIEIRTSEESKKTKDMSAVNDAKRALEEAKKEQEIAEKKKGIEEKLEKDKNEIQKKAFAAEKAGNIAKVWINAALGVVSAWASAMQLGPIAGPIMGGILTATILGIAGGQTAAIATQQYPGFGDGVTNFGGGTAMVGEKGPEMVTLGRGANVVTNQNTSRILSAMSQKTTDDENNINYITELVVNIDGEMVDQRTIENRRYAEARIGVI